MTRKLLFIIYIWNRIGLSKISILDSLYSKMNYRMRQALKTINILESFLGETKLICWSTCLADPILSKNKKMILQNFGQLAFF